MNLCHVTWSMHLGPLWKKNAAGILFNHCWSNCYNKLVVHFGAVLKFEVTWVWVAWCSRVRCTLTVLKNKRSPYWNSTSGFDLDHFAVSGVLFCIRLPNFVQIGTSIAEIWRHIDFQDEPSSVRIYASVRPGRRIERKRTVYRTKKSQKCYNSPISGEAAAGLIRPKTCVVGDVGDIISNHVCQVSNWNLDGLRFYRGSNFRFCYWFFHGPYNSAALIPVMITLSRVQPSVFTGYTQFFSRVSILTRDIDIANLSVCPGA